MPNIYAGFSASLDKLSRLRAAWNADASASLRRACRVINDGGKIVSENFLLQ